MNRRDWFKGLFGGAVGVVASSVPAIAQPIPTDKEFFDEFLKTVDACEDSNRGIIFAVAPQVKNRLMKCDPSLSMLYVLKFLEHEKLYDVFGDDTDLVNMYKKYFMQGILKTYSE